MNRDVVEDQRAVRVVAETHAVEQDIAVEVLDGLSFGVRLDGLGEERPDLLERRHDGSDGSERRPEAGHRRLKHHQRGVGDEKVADRDGAPARIRSREQQGRAGQERKRRAQRLQVLVDGAELQLRLFLIPVVLRPHREPGPFGAVDTQLGDSVDELEQSTSHPMGGADDPAPGRNLAQAEHHGHDQGQQPEGERHYPQHRVVQEDEDERRRQEHDRQHGVGDHALHRVAKVLERRSPRGEIAGGVPVQEARAKPEQTVPERRLDSRYGASFEAHQRHALRDVHKRPDQGERGQRRDRRIQQAVVAGGDRLVGDEAQDHRGQQHHQSARQTGRHHAREVGGQPLPRKPEQVARADARRRQRPVEHPRVGAERFGPRRRQPGTAARDGIHLPIAPRCTRQQCHRPAVIGPERKHCAAVAGPPAVLRVEPHAATADSGRIQDMGENGGGIGCIRRSGPVEVDPLMTGDERQRLEQRRFALSGRLFVQQAVQVEQAAPGAFLVGAAAGRARPRQVGLIHDRETTVEPLERERGGVEARQCGQQGVLVGENFGGASR